MTRSIAILAPFLLVSLAHAAPVSTTLTVANAPMTVSGTGTSTSATVTGTATLTNIGGGAFSATGSLSGINGTNIVAPFTIQLSGTDSITGNLTIPLSVLNGTANQVSGSATVTGGTGIYANATGSFPSLTGTTSGSILTSDLKLSFSGSGTIDATGGSGGGSTTPTVTAVLDAASNTAGVVEGSIFIVKGSNLAPSGLLFTSFPLPTTTSNGVKITFTPAGGGTGTDADMIYTCNISEPDLNIDCLGDKQQLAAVLPSTLPTGTYNLTVTNNGGVSAPFSAKVLARKFTVFTADESGSGLAVVQNYISATQVDLNRFTSGTVNGYTMSPAHPGQPVIVWGTGMGPVTFADNIGSPGYDFSKNGVNVQAIVGGVTIPVQYAGRTATLAGEDEVVFNLPANVPTGCTVPLQISVDGQLSQPTFIAIAPDANSSACVQPGFTTQQLQNFDNGNSFTAGYFLLLQLQETLPAPLGNYNLAEVAGGFVRYTGFQLAQLSTLPAYSPTGACQVTSVTVNTNNTGTGGTGTTVPGIPVNLTDLDAGKILLSGPSGSGVTNVALTEDPSTYAYSLALSNLTPGNTTGVQLPSGTYTLLGAGGKDVGAFNASVALSSLSLTGGFPAAVPRSSDLVLNWTGGVGSDLVEIAGYSTALTAPGVYTSGSFTCLTTAGAGTFTVPASVLAQLPPDSADPTSGSSGSLELFTVPNFGNGNGQFTAPLTSGGNINLGLFLAYSGTAAPTLYQ